MALKLAGHTTKSIAEKMRCDRTTVYRRCQAVQNEYLAGLEGKSSLNLITITLQRLENIHSQAMQEHETSTSARVRDMSLNTARRAANDILKTYLETGIIERAAERLYQTVLTMKPSDFDEKPDVQISREEAVEELIEKLRAGKRLA